jgi:peptidyl-prolyl cis-trans isomerase C
MTTPFRFIVGIALVLALPLAAVQVHAADIAKVNGKAITDTDIAGALSGLTDAQRASALKDPSTRRQILVGLIDQELLVQQAEKEKLDADEEFKAAVLNFRRQYLASRVVQKNTESKLTDGAAKKFYESHKNLYSTDQVHALHILVNDEAAAKDVMKQLKGKDDDAFKDLAEKVSKDPSAKNNRGDLGFFGRGRMIAEFSDAAFAGKDGAMIGPVKTTYGYHVIKVLKKRMGAPLSYSDIELKVKNDLRSEVVQNYVGRVKQQAKIQIEEKLLDQL